MGGRRVVDVDARGADRLDGPRVGVVPRAAHELGQRLARDGLDRGPVPRGDLPPRGLVGDHVPGGVVDASRHPHGVPEVRGQAKGGRRLVGHGEAVDDAARELLVDVAAVHEQGRRAEPVHEVGDVAAGGADLQPREVRGPLDAPDVVVEDAGAVHEEAQQLDPLVLGLGVQPPGVHPPERPRARRRVVADERELGEPRPGEPVVPRERVEAVGQVGDAVDGQVVVRRRRAQRPRQQAHRHPALGHRLDLLDPGLERVGDDGVPRREPRRHHQLGLGVGRGLLGVGRRGHGLDGQQRQQDHPPAAGAPARHLSSSLRCIQAACCGARLVSDHSRSISHFTASSLASMASSSGSGHASSMRCPLGSKK